MKRKLLLSISVILVLCLGVAIFCGCGNSGNSGNDVKTVSFYYGDELLGTYDVDNGTSFATIGKIHPKENAEGNNNFFINTAKGKWYTDSSCTSKIDNSLKITSNMSVYLKKDEANADNMEYLKEYVKSNGSINSDGNYVLSIYSDKEYNNYIEVYSDNSGFNINGTSGYSDGYIVFAKNNRPDNIFIIDNGSADKIIVKSYDNHKIGDDYTIQSDNVGSFTAGLCVISVNSTIRYIAYTEKNNNYIFPFDVFDGTPIR